MDTVQFHFELRQLVDVEPWGTAESGLRLHWFGLTDGWYDIIIGEQHRLFSQVDDRRGIDYQVARLWEDLIEVVPAVLERVPQPLVAKLANVHAWQSWVEKACASSDRRELKSTALSWWFNRQLHAHHLVDAPSLAMWRSGDDVHMHWRSRPRRSEGPGWASPNGEAITKAETLRAELNEFDRDLIAAMEARITAIERSWSKPEIEIDIEDLRRDHTRRVNHLECAVRYLHYYERDWDDVMGAMLELEREVGCVDLDGSG